VDTYLFIGKLAIQAYDEEKTGNDNSNEINELEKTLEELDTLNPSDLDIKDPRVQEIRNHLVGFPSILVSSPGFDDWKKAVTQTAYLIAKKCFPESERPLEEAALGPLLKRSRIWINSLCETETVPVVKSFHRVKIESLSNMKSFTDNYLPKQVRKVIKKSWELYGWMKWPYKVYRWVKRGSPAGIAVDVGRVVVKKGFINFVCRRSFDMAYNELEIVYNQSKSGD
jgi:hypothetical protein